jgi:hypothetical protein
MTIVKRVRPPRLATLGSKRPDSAAPAFPIDAEVVVGYPYQPIKTRGPRRAEGGRRRSHIKELSSRRTCALSA